MKSIKFNETSDYQMMEVLDVEGVFTNLRIDEQTLPEGFYKYSLREGEEEFIAAIEKNVAVNHAGDFITKQEIDLGPEGYKDLKPDDWGFTDKDFEFETYFGCKLSLDCQIDNANAKKEAQMGGNSKEKQQAHDEPEKDELL